VLGGFWVWSVGRCWACLVVERRVWACLGRKVCFGLSLGLGDVLLFSGFVRVCF
jgi:hypothetical protein